MKYLKLLPCLFIMALLAIHCRSTKTSASKTAYYFCVSRSWAQTLNIKPEYVIISGIQKINNDETVINVKADEWYTYIEKICKNEAGCTSDLNYYPTSQEAEAIRNDYLKKYNNTDNYIVTFSDFK